MLRILYLPSQLLIIASFLGTLLAQSPKKPYIIQDQLSLDVPTEVSISPDAGKILFTIVKPDTINSKWTSQIYLKYLDSNEVVQITNGQENCHAGKFSPDGKTISFLSARKVKNDKSGKFESIGTQLFILPQFGESKNITSVKNGVLEYIWSPDSKKIAFLSEQLEESEQFNNDRNENKKIDAKVFPEVKPVKVLNIFDMNQYKIVSTFKLDKGAEKISFDNIASKIVFQTNATGEFDDEQKYDIFTIDIDGNKTQLTNNAGPETSPRFSKDGKFIAFKTQTVADIEFAETDLNIISTETKIVTNLSKELNLAISDFLWKDENTILFTVSEKTSLPIYQVDIRNSKLSKVSVDNEVISDLSFSANNTLCYKLQTANELPEIIVNGKKVTNFSQQLDKYNLGKQEPIAYKSYDSKFDLEGVVCYPPNFNPSKKYPLIAVLHGGPYGVTRNVFIQNLGLRIFASKGYIAFSPNPRGSQGFSDEFSQSNRYDLGGGDYQDIMTGVDFLISKGFVDENRMGITGGSYGGYLTNWIISQTTRFKAAVSMYGIFNFITDWSNSWQPSFEKMYFGYYYWDRPLGPNNLYVTRSPAYYVKAIKTPTLILQGEKDVYTDIANSREMYQALHTLKIPCEFVIYERAGHGIRNEPNQYIDVIERSCGWFEKYLK